MSEINQYVTVQQDCRAYGDMRRTHKMGWLRANDVIHLVGEYGNWRRFEPWVGCADLVPTDDSYRDYYVHIDDLISEEPPPPPPPPPGEVDDAELGKALRVLVNFFASALKDS